MPKKIRGVEFYDVCRKEFAGNKSYDTITVDGDGTVCAWSGAEPVYDSALKNWDNGTFNYHILGKLVESPEYVDFSEEIYPREMFVPNTVEQTENVEDKESFSAKALKATADSTASNVIFNGLKHEAITLAKLGKYSASTWVGWIEEPNRARHVYDAIECFEALGFKVKFDRAKSILEISW